MANLGNLYYDVRLKDMTDADKDAIRKKIENMSARIGNVSIDTKAIQSALSKALSGANKNVSIKVSKIDIDRQAIIDALNKAANSKSKFAITISKFNIDRQELYNSINKALQNKKFSTTLSPQLDVNALAAKIKSALASAGVSGNPNGGGTTGGANGNGIDNINKKFKYQQFLVGQLAKEIAGLYSIHTMKSFISSLIEIGGEFQKQHIAITAMLGDAGKADALFGKMKQLAVESPFTFMNIASYTKQLAAFSIPYNELFDTTKRLADISAGLGVDMGRIILAYGQVRSAAVLRGQELRQFTEAGIPLVQALADKFSLLENRVVSAGEVFEKISKREVSFQMVKDILWQLTDEGGQFYNMQSKLVESLSGKAEKFKDSWQIMLSSIANSSGGILGGALDKMTDMTKEWEKIAKWIAAIIGLVGGYKTALLITSIYHKIINSSMAKSLAIADATILRAKALNVHVTKTGYLIRSLGKSMSLVGVAFGAILAILAYTYTAIWESRRFINELNNIRFNGDSGLKEQINDYENLITQLKSLKQGTKEYNDIKDKIQQRYGQYLSGINMETASYDELAASIDGVTNSLRNKAAEEARQKVNTVIDEEYEKRTKGDKENIEGWIDSRKYILGINGSDFVRLFVGEIKKRLKEGSLKGTVQSSEQAKLVNGLVNEVVRYLGYDKNLILNTTMRSNAFIGLYNTLAEAEQRRKRELDKITDSFKSNTFIGANIEKLEEDFNEKMKKSESDEERERLEIELLRNKAIEYRKAGFEKEAKLMDDEIVRMGRLHDNWVELTKTTKVSVEEQVKGWDKLKSLSEKDRNAKVSQSLMPSEEEAKGYQLINYLVRLAEAYEDVATEYNRYMSLNPTYMTDDMLRSLGSIKAKKDFIEQFFYDMGYNLEDFQKTTKSGSGGSNKDTFLEQLKDRLRLLKEAYAEYKKWKKIMNEDDALAKVKNSGIFNALFPDGDFSKLKNYTAEVEKIKKELENAIKKSSTEQRKNALKDVYQLLFNFEYDENTEELNKALERTKKDISDTVKQWDLYKQLFAATGDKENSLKTAFSYAPVWDDAAEELRNKLEQMMKDKNVNIELSFTWNDEEAKQAFGQNSSLFEIWKTIKERIEKNGIDLKVNAANAIRDTMSVEEKIKSLEAQKNEELSKYTSGTPEYEAIADKWDKQIFDVRKNLTELNPAYEALMSDSTGMTLQRIQQIRDSAKALLDLINASKVGVFDKNGKLTGYNYTYTDKDGNQQTGSVSIQIYKEVNKRMEQLGKKGETVGTKMKRVWQWISGEEDENGDKKANFEDVIQDLSDISKVAADLAGQLSTMFDALGNESMAQTMDNLQAGMESAANIGEGFAKGGIIGGIAAAAGEAIKWVGRLAQQHDAKLDKAIQESQKEVKKLQNAYKNLENEIANQLGSVTQKQGRKMMESLKSQRKEIEKQQKLESQKKKKDADKIDDYKQQIIELDEQIKTFYENWAEKQYDVNIKSWASDLASALVDAFSKGEDAAEAFDAKVADIMKSVVTKMIQLQVIEPAMSSLRNKLFGDNGIFTSNSEMGMDISPNEAKKLVTTIADLKDTINRSRGIYESIEKAAKEVGVNLSESGESASGLSRDIKGITEEQANLLASYLNAVRADVSVLRNLREELRDTMFPQFNAIAQSQLQQLRVIAENTSRNVGFVEEIRDIMYSNVRGVNKFNI